ncbi:ABC transporter ATP-binding protein [Candidatus Woesearchaeota archaeon]|nr:ABC transporter ATP-binding protein [Candidatus Woesearchaeota archaeon]
MVGEILKIENLSKSFGKKAILKSISLNVEEGEILGVIGASGSGKTTLLKTIIGFHKPESGDVKFRHFGLLDEGKKVRRDPFVSVYDESSFAKNMFGFASQTPSFYDNLQVRENMLYFGALYGLGQKELETNINILLTLMDLKKAESSLAGKLSGGMQRRLDIACAMIHDPAILFLDEPTSDLDPALRNHIWSLVRKINKRGTTIILASHHLAEVEAFCSRIAIIKEGQLVDVDTPSRLKAKYADSQEIEIQSYPGHYHNILDALRKKCKDVTAMKISSSGLIVTSRNTKNVLHEILHIMEKLDEELIDINVAKPGLDDLFLKITQVHERSEHATPHHQVHPNHPIHHRG